jgi:hypothetical protein
MNCKTHLERPEWLANSTADVYSGAVVGMGASDAMTSGGGSNPVRAVVGGATPESETSLDLRINRYEPAASRRLPERRHAKDDRRDDAFDI